LSRVRVCLMVEGQEDVTWDDWRALARACEEHGVESLFEQIIANNRAGGWRRLKRES
jgi:hypothetical protein